MNLRIAIVVAAADNGVIGKGNALPWRLPDDLKRFKQVTMGKPVVMGRKTHDSIGKPLPGRENIVITRQSQLVIPGCTVASSLADALRVAAASGANEVAVIGGAEIFRQALAMTNTIHLTSVHGQIDGDTFFCPSLSPERWRETSREEHAADERHAYPFTFLTFERRL